MRYMLDSDTCSFIIKQVPSVVRKAREFKGEWCISSVVYQELMSGLLVTNSKRMEDGYQLFLSSVEVLEFSMSDALVAAELLVENRKRGHNIGMADNQIAGHAASANLTLVTNNTKHFAPMLGVHVTNWVA